MNTRPALEKDIPALLDLLTQVDMVHHNTRPDLFKGPATKYSATELQKILKDADTPVFVCVNEHDAVLGYAFCIFRQFENDRVMTDIKTLYIDDICVDESARGMNVGRTLYDHVIQFAKDSGCYNVTLNVWSCNPGALKFYEKCGLVPQKVGMEKIL